MVEMFSQRLDPTRRPRFGRVYAAGTNVGLQFNNATIVLDGYRFTNCEFNNCIMEYSGGQPPELIGCTFNACEFDFAGAAGNTLAFMGGMYKGMGVGGKQLIERTFANITADACGSSPSLSAQKPPKTRRSKDYIAALCAGVIIGGLGAAALVVGLQVLTLVK
jgi:hypothetical protein